MSETASARASQHSQTFAAAAPQGFFYMTGNRRRQLVSGIRLAALATIITWALVTPGFLTPLSLFSLLTAISFIGCVATGMTYITLTGNIMSLCLGATVAASALVFMASLGLGVFAASIVAILFGVAITAAQGVVVGYFRANAILVSIASLARHSWHGRYPHRPGQRMYPAGGGFETLQGAGARHPD